MKNEQNAPKIRFKGFTDAWEQRELGKIGETYTGLTGKTKEDFGHGEAKFVTYMNVFSNPVAEISMTEPIEIDKKQNEVKFGDVFFTTSSETPEEVGMSSVWLENCDNMYLNSFCFGYRPSEKINPYYMAYMLRSENVRKKITFLAQGISRYNISKNKMMEISIPLPSFEEQRQIGAYFRNLDHLITLHQRKCETLKKLKKSMLQKMFPKNGSHFPEIRFAGFTDAWELRKLSLSFDILQNNTLSRSELSIENGAARNVHYGDILVKYGEVLDLKTEELPFIQSSQTVDKLKGSFLQNGDIIMADTAEDETAGKCTEIANLDNMNVLAGLHTIPLRPKQKYAVGYLGYYMNSGSFHDKLLPLMQGTKVTSISKSALQGMSILRPADLEEQRQIGTYFRTLDRLITLHQRKQKKPFLSYNNHNIQA